jgi:hypothetical protein
MSVEPDNELLNELEGLVFRFGYLPVKKTLAKLADKGPGRPSEPDWHKLHPWFIELTVAYANGQKAKTNYRIANEFALKYPGQSVSSTVDRIERKLKDWRDSVETRYLDWPSVKRNVSVENYLSAIQRAKDENKHLPLGVRSWDEFYSNAQSIADRLDWLDDTSTMSFADAERQVLPPDDLDSDTTF